MILFLECILACAIFSAIMVGGVLWKPEAFLHDYAPEVQARYRQAHPAAPRQENRLALIIVKLLMCALFIVVLTVMIRIAGANTFAMGTAYAYIIWLVVNWFDVVALDIGVFAHWKAVRLPGTEHMDAEYVANWRKHVRDGFIGMGIGVPVALVCGALTALL